MIDTKNGKIKIIKCYYKIYGKYKNGKDKKYKYYDYVCINCGAVGTKDEGSIRKGKGCYKCGPKINKKYLNVGVNDLKTKIPNIEEYLLYKQDSEKYSYNSSKSIYFVCPICKNIVKRKIVNFYRNGINCPNCSDSISFSNKFIFNFLKQCDVHFETEKSFEWSGKRRYDFYIPNLDIIIEVNGDQHYNGFNFSNKECIQLNDENKKQMAIKNGVKNYIVLDCRKSELEFIRNSIEESDLPKLIDISMVNWGVCEKSCITSLGRKIINLFNDGRVVKDIAEILNISKQCVCKYLKIGNKYNICNYIPKHFNNITNKKKVYSIIDDIYFESISECARHYNVSRKYVVKEVDKFKVM